MANYAATNHSSAGSGTQISVVASSYQHMISAGSSTTLLKRGRLYDVLIGTAGTPADLVTEYQISRITTISTAVAAGTLVVAQPLDMADGPCASIVTLNSTGTPTVSVPNLWYVGVNCRASYRWVAAPGSEFIWPATASAGLSLQVIGTYTGTATGTILFSE